MRSNSTQNKWQSGQVFFPSASGARHTTSDPEPRESVSPLCSASPGRRYSAPTPGQSVGAGRKGVSPTSTDDPVRLVRQFNKAPAVLSGSIWAKREERRVGACDEFEMNPNATPFVPATSCRQAPSSSSRQDPSESSSSRPFPSSSSRQDPSESSSSRPFSSSSSRPYPSKSRPDSCDISSASRLPSESSRPAKSLDTAGSSSASRPVTDLEGSPTPVPGFQAHNSPRPCNQAPTDSQRASSSSRAALGRPDDSSKPVQHSDVSTSARSVLPKSCWSMPQADSVPELEVDKNVWPRVAVNTGRSKANVDSDSVNPKENLVAHVEPGVTNDQVDCAAKTSTERFRGEEGSPACAPVDIKRVEDTHFLNVRDGTSRLTSETPCKMHGLDVEMPKTKAPVQSRMLPVNVESLSAVNASGPLNLSSSELIRRRSSTTLNTKKIAPWLLKRRSSATSLSVTGKASLEDSELSESLTVAADTSSAMVKQESVQQISEIDEVAEVKQDTLEAVSEVDEPCSKMKPDPYNTWVPYVPTRVATDDHLNSPIPVGISFEHSEPTGDGPPLFASEQVSMMSMLGMGDMPPLKMAPSVFSNISATDSVPACPGSCPEEIPMESPYFVPGAYFCETSGQNYNSNDISCPSSTAGSNGWRPCPEEIPLERPYVLPGTYLCNSAGQIYNTADISCHSSTAGSHEWWEGTPSAFSRGMMTADGEIARRKMRETLFAARSATVQHHMSKVAFGRSPRSPSNIAETPEVTPRCDGSSAQFANMITNSEKKLSQQCQESRETEMWRGIDVTEGKVHIQSNCLLNRTRADHLIFRQLELVTDDDGHISVDAEELQQRIRAMI